MLLDPGFSTDLRQMLGPRAPLCDVCMLTAKYGYTWCIQNAYCQVWVHLVYPERLLPSMGTPGVSRTLTAKYGYTWCIQNAYCQVWVIHLVYPERLLPSMGTPGVSRTLTAKFGLYTWCIQNAYCQVWVHLVYPERLLPSLGHDFGPLSGRSAHTHISL